MAIIKCKMPVRHHLSDWTNLECLKTWQRVTTVSKVMAVSKSGLLLLNLFTAVVNILPPCDLIPSIRWKIIYHRPIAESVLRNQRLTFRPVHDSKGPRKLQNFFFLSIFQQNDKGKYVFLSISLCNYE